MFCLQLSACPAHALKARQSQITVLRHHFRKGHRPCVLKIAVTYFQIQHHIVISGFLVLFQNGSHLILNGSQFLHTYLRIWKGDSPKRLPPDTLLLLSVTDVQPDCSAHNEHHKHNGDHRLYFHSLVLLLLLFQPCDQERTCTNEGNCRQSSPEERIEVIPCFRGVTQFIVHLNNRS